LAVTSALTGTVVTQTRRETSAALDSMADAERAFARTALEKGIRDAFVAFFADDSVGFYPTPMNGLEFYKNLPPTPLTRRLEWEPRSGDIAQTGDFGWLTGPFTSRNMETGAPPGYGCYFSIWKQQSNGTWKVLMDVGITTPGAASFPAGFSGVSEPNGRYVAKAGSPRPASDTVMSLDRSLADSARSEGIDKAYDRVLDAVSRLHVPGHQPFVGRASIVSWLRDSKATAAHVPEAGTVAASGELGFTRGSYEHTTASSDPPEKGYYVRIWKRVADGRWMLGVEVRSPLPPPKE
jgi:ketosteroid isomerase-like protein